MDIKTTLVASADPVIGVMNQSIDTDATGRKVLKGQLLRSERTDRERFPCDRNLL
jgi:hypothetical protein